MSVILLHGIPSYSNVTASEIGWEIWLIGRVHLNDLEAYPDLDRSMAGIMTKFFTQSTAFGDRFQSECD